MSSRSKLPRRTPLVHDRGMHAETAVAGQTLGVIDIGSNSGRVMVARVLGAAHLDVLGDARSPLRLVRDVATAAG